MPFAPAISPFLKIGDAGRSHPLSARKTCQNKVLDPRPQPLNPIFKVNTENILPDSSLVYFTDARLKRGVGGLTQKFTLILEKSSLKDIIKPGDVAAVKMHFGEPGNARYIRPIYPVLAVDFIKKLGGRPFVTDTTVMYHTDRKDFFKYLDHARRHGFTNEVLGCPLIISGAFRDHGVKVKVPDPIVLPEVTVSQEIWESDVVFLLTHFTMHLEFPFGASVKNLSMGCVDQKTKLAMHSQKKFRPFHLNSQAANTDGAKVLMQRFREKIYAVNLAIDITPECDCFDKSDLPIVPDLGIFASFDPAACDQAAFAAVINAPGYPGCLFEGTDAMKPGSNKVAAIHPKQDDYQTYNEFIRQAGIGNLKYELVEV